MPFHETTYTGPARSNILRPSSRQFRSFANVHGLIRKARTRVKQLNTSNARRIIRHLEHIEKRITITPLVISRTISTFRPCSFVSESVSEASDSRILGLRIRTGLVVPSLWTTVWWQKAEPSLPQPTINVTFLSEWRTSLSPLAGANSRCRDNLSCHSSNIGANSWIRRSTLFKAQFRSRSSRNSPPR